MQAVVDAPSRASVPARHDARDTSATNGASVHGDAHDARLTNGTHAHASVPDPHDIAVEAYIIYCETGFVEGRDVDHWLEAERRVKARESEAAASSGSSAHAG